MNAGRGPAATSGRLCSIIALGTLQPGEVFDISPGEPLPGSLEVFLDPQQVDGRTSCRRTESLPGHLAANGMLQVEEPGYALDVGEGLPTRPHQVQIAQSLVASLMPAYGRMSGSLGKLASFRD